MTRKEKKSAQQLAELNRLAIMRCKMERADIITGFTVRKMVKNWQTVVAVVK